MNKKIVSNLTLTAISGALVFLFSSQFSQMEDKEKFSNEILKNNDSLNRSIRNVVLSVEAGNESGFDLLNRDIISLKNSVDFYIKNKEKLSVKNEMDYIEKELKLIIVDLEKIKENKEGVLNIDEVFRQLNNTFKEIDLLKSGLINSLNQEMINSTPARKAKLQDGVKYLNLTLKKLNEIKNNLVEKSRYNAFKNDMNNIINYFEMQFSDLLPNNVVFQKTNVDLVAQVKNFKEKANLFIESKYNIEEIKNIQGNKDRLLKKMENLQFNLIKMFDKNKNNKDMFFYLIALLSLILVGIGFILVNNKAELSKKDRDNLQKYSALSQRNKTLQNSIDRIVVTDNYGYTSINQGAFIEETSFKDSKLSNIVRKLNELLKVFYNIRFKMDNLTKAAREQISPVVTKYKALKNLSQNNNTYNIVENNYILEETEEIKNKIEEQEKIIDIISGDSGNLNLNLNEYLNDLSNNKDRLNILREKMQESSKQVKQTGEITQKLMELQEDMSSVHSKIGVVSLNLGIDSSNDESSVYYNYANELQELLKTVEEVNGKIKQYISDIQKSSKETTENLENITNKVVEDSVILEKNKEKIDKTISKGIALEKNSYKVFSLIDQIKLSINNIKNNTDSAKNKDHNKTDLLEETENILNKILETIK